ncbi:hypothetical protein MJL30_38385, partial [Salmonella enterica subsp. enterica serovar Anatum]|nr:hypothetical protein [Salmonella enterica subsp. enterica serovar Anatum]
RLHFQALDSTQFATAQGETPDLVLVNPPRRGIGKPLCDYLAHASVTVTLEPGRALDEGQISAVVHLVSSAVAGLPPGNVTLVDQ